MKRRVSRIKIGVIVITCLLVLYPISKIRKTKPKIEGGRIVTENIWEEEERKELWKESIWKKISGNYVMTDFWRSAYWFRDVEHNLIHKSEIDLLKGKPVIIEENYIMVYRTSYQITGYYGAAPQIEERIVTDFSYEVRNIPYEELMFESTWMDSSRLLMEIIIGKKDRYIKIVITDPNAKHEFDTVDFWIVDENKLYISYGYAGFILERTEDKVRDINDNGKKK